MPKSWNFDATTVSFRTPNASEEIEVPHSHGRPPADAFILDRFGSGLLYRGGTRWTDENIYVKSSVAGSGFTLLLFGQEAQAVSTKRVGYDVHYRSSPPSAADWPDAATNSISLFFAVPLDYSTGDLSFNVFRRAGAAAGTAVMRRTTYRDRDATALNTIETNTNINFTPGDTNAHLHTFTVAAASIAVGDVIRVDISRTGADGSDTLAGYVEHGGGWVDYTAS